MVNTIIPYSGMAKHKIVRIHIRSSVFIKSALCPNLLISSRYTVRPLGLARVSVMIRARVMAGVRVRAGVRARVTVGQTGACQACAVQSPAQARRRRYGAPGVLLRDTPGVHSKVSWSAQQVAGQD